MIPLKEKVMTFKKIRFFTILSLIILVGCSDVPMRLNSTAERSMKFLAAGMTPLEGFLEPVLVDQHQMAEELWCLTYEIGPDYFFSSRWKKQEYDWKRTELRSFTTNCNWAR
jgi:hypothetical protein